MKMKLQIKRHAAWSLRHLSVTQPVGAWWPFRSHELRHNRSAQVTMWLSVSLPGRTNKILWLASPSKAHYQYILRTFPAAGQVVWPNLEGMAVLYTHLFSEGHRKLEPLLCLPERARTTVVQSLRFPKLLRLGKSKPVVLWFRPTPVKQNNQSTNKFMVAKLE